MKLSMDAILSKEETRWSGVREVLLLALPIIISVGSNTIMSAVDVWMVAQLGRDEVAGIIPASITNSVLISFFIGVMSCVSTFVGQSYGRGSFRLCSHYAWQGIYISLLIGVLAMALWPPTPAIFRLCGHASAVQVHEVAYFQWRLLGVGGAIMSVALASFFTATSKPVIPMVATVAANLVNLVGDYLLIFGKFGFPKWGVAGAAIATNVAAWLCALMMFAVFLSKDLNAVYKSRKTRRWDSRKVRQLFRIGWPAGLSMGLDIGSWAVFIVFLVGRFGTDAIAASGITGQILSGSFMPTVGLSIAVTALVGQWIGRGSLDRAKARYRTALKIGIIYMTLMGLVFVVFRHDLIRLFRDDPEIVKLGGTFLIFAAAFQFFDAISIVTSGALKGAGDTRWPMVASMVSAWLVFLPLGYVLAFRTSLGVVGGWISATIYIYLLGSALFLRFLSGKWMKVDIFHRPGRQSIIPIQAPPPTGSLPPAPGQDRLDSGGAGAGGASPGPSQPDASTRPEGSKQNGQNELLKDSVAG